MIRDSANTRALRVNSYVTEFRNATLQRAQKYASTPPYFLHSSFNRTLRREFGPAAYGVFLAKNVKACRGVRGKSYTIRISDTKWRYPKRGRH